MAEHLKEEFYFTDAIMLTTQNNSFGPTEISYLENRFTNMARETDRYIIKNGNEPNPGNVTEEKESELEDFVEYSKMVLGVLGYKIFVPLVKTASSIIAGEDKDEEQILYLNRKLKRSNKTVEAKCKMTSEGFVVLKGSHIEGTDAESIPNSLKSLREKCRRNKEIIDGKITKDYLFKSPSYAASFVVGMSSNGRTDWKTKDGITLKALEEKDI